ncbi:MBL fold metallo-hydrolase [Nakamurella flavida]|uniref:MBL fold metallo-hydrolase n=1 Tax=Nakamurella flavida TaxID=363630 RepID=A0A938YNF5_9ACTN|nr:MBL fold metallo-hydrolase [Nakamurella flavida]MBM9476273.1 MBL fold metallo-hydrolase [Nakamurella flavida]MDP9779627.1 glyoxylase-like metal-dependent hydrolase (beta-lactamase superfamily II) [Nakamurella flavida]
MSWREVVTGPDLRVLVRTARRDRTTATVIAWAGRAVLVDPSWDPDELADIADRLEAERLTVVAGFATHAHHDHVLWHPRFGSAPRWASPAAADRSRRDRPGLAVALGPDFPPELVALAGDVRALDADRIPWDGPELRLVTHRAHSPGHTAVWLPDARVLLAGDMLSDVELPLPDQGPHALADHEHALTLLHPYVRRAALLVPGHGTVSDAPMDRWAADRNYLTAVLTGADPVDPRLTLPGMSEVHRDTVRQASAHLDDGLDLDG